MNQPSKPAPPAAPENAEAVRNVWLAGLGAFAQAQARGTELFDSLVQAGVHQQAKARQLAQAELSKAAEQLATMAGAAPLAPWDRLSGIFEGRVARALEQLGMPGPEAIQRLQARVEELEARVSRLEAGKPEPADTPPSAQARPAAKRSRTKGGSGPAR